MKEENNRAAVQIFEQANEYLLPENILDLHGLHVDEAMKHFRSVLQEKTEGSILFIPDFVPVFKYCVPAD